MVPNNPFKIIYMRIEHAALYVENLENSRRFFEKYFSAVSGKLYHNPKTGFLLRMTLKRLTPTLPPIL